MGWFATGVGAWAGRFKPESEDRWALTFASGRALGVRAIARPGAPAALLERFDIPCSLSDAKAASKALSKAGVKAGARVILVAASEDCAVALMDEIGAQDSEAEQALRWKMAERVDFDMSEAILEVQKAPGAQAGGLQKPSWWAVAMPQEKLREQLRALDELGALCDRVECAAFLQSALAAMGWEQQKARALVCVSEAEAALSFTAGGALLFHKRLEWSAGEIDGALAASWDRLELELVRSLDYFERRLSSVAVGELCFWGAKAQLCANAMSERAPLPCAAMGASPGWVDEAGALDEGGDGRHAWLAAALILAGEGSPGALRRVNLHRPLLAGPKAKARRARALLGLGLGLAVLGAGALSSQSAQESALTEQAERVEALIKQERERQKALALVEPQGSGLANLARSWEARVEAKEALLEHPGRVEPAQLEDWRGMLGALEEARRREPGARVERFEASVASDGGEPSVRLEGVAPSARAALGLARAASDSEALSRLGLSHAGVAPAGALGWSVTLKAGSAK